MPEANPLRQLNDNGQSVWLDNLSRALIRSGELRRLIHEDGITGITSNPAIFAAAIAGSADYDGQIRDLAGQDMDTLALYETLAIEDIRSAADLLRPVYDRTGGRDGFVSLEVNPHLARDTEGTLDEAQRLWQAVGRRNLMIKIPGTVEGAPAIEEALFRGININVTLLFSIEAHSMVMQAHQKALERRLDAGLPLHGLASVASFFLSRIDTLIDAQLDAMDGEAAVEARALRGTAAIASAKAAYRRWGETYAGPAWQRLADGGAQVQRPLWASTSTKDPAYPDTKYVEPLVGEHTVNTLPEVTIAAFRDHGVVVPGSIGRGLKDALAVPGRLAALGIDLEAATEVLVEEGIEKFKQPFDDLLLKLEEKRKALAA